MEAILPFSMEAGPHTAAPTPSKRQVIGNFLDELVWQIEGHVAPPPE